MSETAGLRVRRNTAALDSMPQLAFQQVLDSQHGRNNTRAAITSRVNEAAKAGRVNAALPPDAWESMDTAVYQAAEDTLTIVDDLLSAGLRYSVDLRAKYDTWGIIDDTGEARVGMTPESQTEESDVIAEEDGSPVPIIDDGFSVGFREEPLNSDRLPEGSLDTTKSTVAGRHVSEAIESMFVNADNIQITGETGEGYTLYGMTDHPETATGNTSADWTSDNTIIRDDIRSARSVLKNDRNYRPGGTGYWCYLGTEYYDVLDDADPEGDGNQTIRDRVENLANVSRVREADFLDSKSMLMFRPTEDVIQVGVGADMQSVQWEDPFRDHFRAMASMYPRIKRTYATDAVSGTYMNGLLYWTAP
jgi:hypothetical protein